VILFRKLTKAFEEFGGERYEKNVDSAIRNVLFGSMYKRISSREKSLRRHHIF
jgi:hypothetical protein